MNPPDVHDTVEIMPSQVTGEGTPAPIPLMVVDLAGLSHPGKVRDNNEDHFLTCRFGRILQTLQTNLPAGALLDRFEDVGHGMVVADGVGGTSAGEEASQRAITMLVSLALQTPDWILRLEEDAFFQEVLRRAARRYGQIDQALTEQAEADPVLHGFATTMTLALSLGANLILAHIGDSRAYLFRAGSLHRLTHDHTIAQALADQGIIAPQEVATHRLRHVLTRCLGGGGGVVSPEVKRLEITDGDVLLLCTDGLTEMVADSAIAETLAAGGPAEATCQRLVDLALEAGGKDNVTVILARFGFSPSSPTS